MKIKFSLHMLMASAGLLLLAGCAVPKSYLSFEVLEPAEVTYPSSVQSVAYLNRAPVSYQSLAEHNRKGLDYVELRMVDTMVCNALKTGFADGSRSNLVTYLDSVYYLESRRYDTLGRSENIRPEQLNKIFSVFPVDAIISLDYYSLNLGEDTYYNFDGLFYEKLYACYMEAGFKFYSREDSLPFSSYVYRDTLYFTNQSNLPASTYVSPTQVIRSSAYECGYQCGQRNVPLWSEVTRTIYRGRESLFLEAATYTDQGEWEAARKLWEQGLDDEDKKISGKSAYNLAVSYEMEDNLEKAVEYAVIAARNYPDQQTETYLDEVRTRLENKKELVKQIR